MGVFFVTFIRVIFNNFIYFTLLADNNRTHQQPPRIIIHFQRIKVMQMIDKFNNNIE